MTNDEWLSAKEVAARLKRSYSYVRAMRRLGCRFVGGRTTMAIVIAWLEENPEPTAKEKHEVTQAASS